MSIVDLFSRKTVFSFEVFPPRRNAPIETIYETLYELQDLRPDFISVTYGAGGGENKQSTISIAEHIKNICHVPSVVHFPCIGLTKEDILEKIEEFKRAGIQNILALRGDIPEGMENRGDFRYASDLVAFLKENGDFRKTEEHGYIDYKAPFKTGQGYFDVNKAPFGKNKEVDQNLCFAAAASNTLHWYLQENRGVIEKYIEDNGDVTKTVGGTTYSLKEMLNQEVEQQESLIYQYFKEIYGNNKTGFYTVPLMDLFLNGYTPKEDRKTNIEDKDLQPDGRGGFLHGILGGKLQTGLRSVKDVKDMGESLQYYLSNGFVLCLSYKTFSYNHVVTLWGAEYDANGRLCAVYVTDSDDQDETGDEVDVAMKRYRVKEEGQRSYLSNAISESSKGALVNSIQYLRFGGEADLED